MGTPTKKQGWIGVDLDGTLAEDHGWKGARHIGKPIKPMVARVRRWLAEGKEVRIFTSRHSATEDVVKPIQQWCRRHLGTELPVTNVKLSSMVELWDDRAVGVEKNVGTPNGRPVHTTASGPEAMLLAAAQTCAERNAVYKDGWRITARVLAELHPKGVTLQTADDHAVFHCYCILVAKLARFANSGLRHLDSIHDIMGYAALIQTALTEAAAREENNQQPMKGTL